MTIGDFLNFFTSFSSLFLVKLAICILLSLYALFAFILIRQVILMGRIIQVPLTSFLKFLSVLHFLASLILLFLAIAIL